MKTKQNKETSKNYFELSKKIVTQLKCHGHESFLIKKSTHLESSPSVCVSERSPSVCVRARVKMMEEIERKRKPYGTNLVVCLPLPEVSYIVVATACQHSSISLSFL